MAKKLYEESSIQGIADAIRAKNGSSDTYTVGDMATAIQNIPTGGGDITGDCEHFWSDNRVSGYEIEINIPNGTTEITNSAFKDCHGLISINIPNSVTQIGNSCFDNCSNLSSINLSNNLMSISSFCFNMCSNLSSINIPNSVTLIGSNSFQACTSLTSINIPSGVASIGEYCFNGCTSLTSINIPSGVTRINQQCFANTKIPSIDIPSGVTRIDANAFKNCNSLMSITCRNTTPPTIQSNTFLNVPATCAIYVPAESVEAYKTAQYWSARANYIQAIPS